MTEEDIRRNWRLEWLSCVAEIADWSTQKSKWLDTENTNPHWSFVEYLCNYFDGLGLEVVSYEGRQEDGYISENELSAIADFHQQIDSYQSPTDDYDHESILRDPKWLRVVASAKRSQERLLDLLSDPAEREAISRVNVSKIEARWMP